MPNYNYQSVGDPVKVKIQRFFESIWPQVYVLFNAFFYGVIGFFKFLIRGFLPGH